MKPTHWFAGGAVTCLLTLGAFYSGIPWLAEVANKIFGLVLASSFFLYASIVLTLAVIALLFKQSLNYLPIGKLLEWVRNKAKNTLLYLIGFATPAGCFFVYTDTTPDMGSGAFFFLAMLVLGLIWLLFRGLGRELEEEGW